MTENEAANLRAELLGEFHQLVQLFVADNRIGYTDAIQICTAAAIDYAAATMLSQINSGNDRALVTEGTQRLAAAAFQGMRIERQKIISEGN